MSLTFQLPEWRLFAFCPPYYSDWESLKSSCFWSIRVCTVEWMLSAKEESTRSRQYEPLRPLGWRWQVEVGREDTPSRMRPSKGHTPETFPIRVRLLKKCKINIIKTTYYISYTLCERILGIRQIWLIRWH